MKRLEAIVPSTDSRGTFDTLERLGINFTYCEVKGRGKLPRPEQERDMGSGRVKMSAEFNSNVLIIAAVRSNLCF
jgi:hypothetical protein